MNNCYLLEELSYTTVPNNYSGGLYHPHRIPAVMRYVFEGLTNKCPKLEVLQLTTDYRFQAMLDGVRSQSLRVKICEF